MEEAARWAGFGLGLLLAIGTVVAVMKTLIVPRRSYSLLAAAVGRLGYRVFYGLAARLRRFDHVEGRMLLVQARSCLSDIAYPMRRVDRDDEQAELDRSAFDDGWRRLTDVGFPAETCADDAWVTFAALRRRYASLAEQVLFWTIAAPGPWTGPRRGFDDLVDRPEEPRRWAAV